MKKSTLIFGMIGIVCGFLVMILSDNDSRRAVFGLSLAFVSGIGIVIGSIFGDRD